MTKQGWEKYKFLTDAAKNAEEEESLTEQFAVSFYFLRMGGTYFFDRYRVLYSNGK